MKKKTFKLKLYDDASKEFKECACVDYDDDLQVVRYKDALYDIPTGLWIVRLVHIQKGYGPWQGCGKMKDLVMTQMIDTIRNNLLFLDKLAKVRKKVKDNNLAPEVNKPEITLFTV